MPNLTLDQLAALAKRGVLNQEIVATLGRQMTAKETDAVKRGRLEWRLSRMKKKEGATDGSGKNWRSELDRLKCKLAEMEVAQKDGTLIPRADVVRQAQEDAAAIRTAMLGMPNALAPQLVGLTEVEAVKVILKDWARSTLQGWHDSLQGAAAEVVTVEDAGEGTDDD
jgi:hypothetical protein